MLDPLRNLTQLALYDSEEPAGGVHELAVKLRQLKITYLWLAACTWLTDLAALASIDTLTELEIDLVQPSRPESLGRIVSASLAEHRQQRTRLRPHSARRTGGAQEPLDRELRAWTRPQHRYTENT